MGGNEQKEYKAANNEQKEYKAANNICFEIYIPRVLSEDNIR